jgi:hypothetical protein
MQCLSEFLQIKKPLLLAALLVFVPMSADQEVFTRTEADNSSAAWTPTDELRASASAALWAALFGIPTTFLLGGASEPSLAIGDFNHDGLLTRPWPRQIPTRCGSTRRWQGRLWSPIRLAIDAPSAWWRWGISTETGCPDQP